MSIIKLKPACKEYLWGGTRLKEEFYKQFDGEKLAETWELSCHEDGQSVIQNGEYAGKTLKQYIDKKGKSVIGTNGKDDSEFPILIKLIDAKDDLSVQVHPDDTFAMEHEKQKGKTEMWYIVDCEDNAYIYYGFQKKISMEEFKERVHNQTLTEVLNKIYVKKGDVLFIEAGTIHAIEKNILVAEIQESSNVTYRIFDYGRIGKDGKPRELHLEKSLDVMDMNPIVKPKSFAPHLVSCQYFTVDKMFLDGIHVRSVTGFVGLDSFTHVLVLDGTGSIKVQNDIQSIRKGDSVFLPAGSGEFEMEGQLEVLMTRI
ncbi:MAG: class I mannose-6-phosphate isomerase [Hespellia sp.]|nr:class I mannose-6-phosphate isomerase [Hespellia sp.]